MPLLRDVIEVLERIYPPAWAADWDAVGLVCGDPEIRVRKILFAIDPTLAVVEEARDWGADLVLTHHPLLLRGVHSVAPTTAKGRVVHELLRDGTALYVAHTNADVAAPGVSDALARVIGLEDLVPLVADPAPPTDKIVMSVPADRAPAVVDAMAAAGGTHPVIGPPLDGGVTAEVRVEMHLPRSAREAVVAAARAAYPHEQPVVDVHELASWSGPTGIGRVGSLPRAITLHELAVIVADALPATVQGVRAAGPEVGVVRRVAVCGGAGDSLLDAVRRSGADAFVTADLRHHPALEAREETGGPPWLVDVSHWASEWPWLAGCADRVAAALSTDDGAQHTTVEVRVSTTRTDPWTLHVPSRGGSA